MVYKIKCDTCKLEYIGETQRILVQRLKEHNGKNEASAVAFHRKQYPTHQIDAFNCEIIDKASNRDMLKIIEMLHILKDKPELNTQHAAQNKDNNNTFKKQLNTMIIGRRV